MAKKPRKERRRKSTSRPYKQTGATRFREGPSPYVLKHRAQQLAKLITIFPHQIAFGLSDREDSAWLYGQLYLVGIISQDQKIVAERLHKTIATYRRLLHKLNGSVSDLSNVGGGSREDLSEPAQKALAKAQAEYDSAIAALRTCGTEVTREIMYGLDKDWFSGDAKTGLELVRKGLDALLMSREDAPTAKEASGLAESPSFVV
jgi:hypothetical protein